ncbi:MAG: redoxin domain-containing protein [Bacteroidota bacterium]
MNKFHKTTTLAVILIGIAIVLMGLRFTTVSSILTIVAFFAAMREVSIYTSNYQFFTVIFSGVVLGLNLDISYGHFPFATIALFILACVPVIRIAFFTTFSYTGYSWFEPVTTAIGIATLVTSNLLYHHHWITYLIPLPIILLDIVFAWGTTSDKNQLLKNARGGYRVQIGKAANEFELPDQDGKLVKLSDFKDERHILLIFVRGDWCPGCHMMLRTYAKNNDKFQSKNVLVMAIGPDPVGVNREMVEKLGLDFKVLSDEGQRTAMIYGVQLKEYDNTFAEKYEEGIPLPASFLIDKKGLVRYVSRPDKVGEFLNPSLIFPIVEQLDGQYRESKDTLLESTHSNDKTSQKEKTVTKEELKNHEDTIDSLKKELNNYSSIIDQANDAMIVIDIVDGKIHQSNPSAAKLLGYPKEELESLSLFDIHPQSYLNQSSKIVADVWEKGGLIYSDIPFVTKSGELIAVECSAKVAPFAGRPAIVIYARDIRERLKMENELNEQRMLIDEKNKDITDSIEYSKRIQRSIFIEKEKLKDYAPHSFILFKPRDVVSGDFYWFTHHTFKEHTDTLMIAAVDCTGHGVPGAFMSIIGNTLLNQAITDVKVNHTPSLVLDYVNTELKKSLNRNSEDTPLRDGMDIALCYIDQKNRKLQYAGANNPLYVVRENEIIILKSDKQPLTASKDSESKPFTNQYLDLKPGDCIYLFTDGYADQFGGEAEKKFMYKRFKETLLSIKDKSMDEQMKALDTTFENWKGQLSQVDDVLVIGIRI